MGNGALRERLTGWRACLVLTGIAGALLLILIGSFVLRIRAEFTPRRIETLEPIEKQTGWDFPDGTRIISAARAHLGMDVAIWALLEMPRDDVRDLLTTPPPGWPMTNERGWNSFQHEEGEGKLPALCMHMSQDYWEYAPDWIPPLPERFEHYIAAYRFGPAYNAREAIAEMGDEDSETATVYVFFTSY